MRNLTSRLTPAVFTSLLLALSACRETKITSYSAPKDPPPPAPAAAPNTNPHAGNLPEGHPPIASNNTNALPSSAAPSAPLAPATPAAPSSPATPNVPSSPASGSLTWTAPAAWVNKPASSMRLASYDLPGAAASDKPADLSISTLGPAMGVGEGLLSNINRWRGQVQLGPINAADLAAQSTTFTANNLSFIIVDFTAPAPTASSPTDQPASRILAAIVPMARETYFFKITGPDPVIARNKTEFLDFLKTVRTR